ncbi:MAG: TetR family transcriptional regulator [Eubacterium sp.]|nr:TetR family transcriptional regulator [Eubacterium sp.]
MPKEPAGKTDRRVIKTKSMLKQSLRELLLEKPFRQITVKELCDRANTSRITFYTYYDDKYDLLDDMVLDMESMLIEKYNQLKLASGEQSNTPTVVHNNIIDAMIYVLEENNDVFLPDTSGNLISLAMNRDNLEIVFSYFQFFIHTIEKLERELERDYLPHYRMSQISAFLIAGICGFYYEADVKQYPRERIKAELHSLITSIFDTNVFFENKA